jgi:hypothetical protein
MLQKVMLQLPQNLAVTVQTVAEQTKRPVEDILVEWLNLIATDLPVKNLNDDQVLALTKLQLDPKQQAKLSKLLNKNQEGTLSVTEQKQLDELMALYRQGLIRKAEALKEAVSRGLMPLMS